MLGSPRAATEPPRSSRPLLGREELLRQALDRLDARGGWITLTGPGGAGKTHLATAIAQAWSGRALWIDLQPARGPEDVERTLSWALEVDPAHGAQGIARALSELGRALVVLDNLEQLSREACERLVGWLRGAPSLRLLVTSRRALQVPEEEAFAVLPFQVPDAEEVFASAAWSLLRASAPAGALDAAGADGAVTLLRALDGLPLAIELAAARLEVLGFSELLRRLEDRFTLLADPDRGALYDTIAWSWALLGEAEQDALAQATVFRAPFSLEAAEAVLAPRGGTVLDALHVLVRRHLVVRDGRTFRLLESVRAFGQQQLTGRAAVDARRRHARWFARRSEAWSHFRARPDDVRQGMAEAPEVLAVLDRMQADPELVPHAVVATDGLVRTLTVRGPAHHTRQVADRILERLPEATPPELARHACRLHLSRALARRRTGDLAGARTDLTRALELARLSGSEELIGVTQANLADLLEQLGELEQADALYRQALPLVDPENNPAVAATLRAQLGALAFGRGEHDAARAWIDEALRHVPDGDAATELEIRKTQGWMAVSLDHADRAEEAFGRAAVLAEALGDLRALGYICQQRALVAEVVLSDLERAEGLFRQSIRAMRDEGDPLQEGYALGFLGRVLVRQRRHDQAAEACEQALDKLAVLPDRYFPWMFEVTLGAARARLGREPVGTDEPVVLTLERGWQGVRDGDLGIARTAAREAADALEASSVDTGMRALLDAAIAELAEQAGAWRIAEDGTWAEPPGQERIDLSRSEANARILSRLARMRVDAPGTGSDVEALVEAGWPGQRVLAKAGANRVRVALSALRKAGLAELVLRGPDGWYLDPEVPLGLATEK